MEWYDEDNQKNIGMFDNTSKHIFFKEIIKKYKPSGKLLEIGCNDGRLFDHFKEFDCYGQDISPLIIKRANLISFGKFKVGDAYTIKGKFDIIISSDLIEHLERPFDHIIECYRKLNKGGILLIFTPNALSWRVLSLISNLDKIPEECEVHINMMTYWRLGKMMANAKFSKLNFFSTDKYSPEISNMLLVVGVK